MAKVDDDLAVETVDFPINALTLAAIISAKRERKIALADISAS